jgi:thiol-disulfide isomerase/thioredoxin
MRAFCVPLFLVSSIAWSQTTKLPANCGGPSRGIQRELLRLEARENLPHLKQKAILEELLAEHPGDLAVQMRYQDFLRSRQRRDELQMLIDKYRQLATDEPNDPQSEYLYARALIGTETPKAMQILQTSAAKFPEYPWLHMGLASIYGLLGTAGDPIEGPFTNPDRARSELDSFLEACPNVLNAEAWELAARNANGDAAAKYIAQLRKNLDGDFGSHHVLLWPIVWNLEMKWSPERERAQKRITDDLKRLEQLRGQRDVSRLLALRDGYKLMGDVASADRVELEIIARWPDDAQARQLFIDRWFFAHQPKSEKDADMKAYHSAYVKMSEAQVKLFPENSRLWVHYLAALGELPDSSSAEIEAAGDGLLNSVKIAAMAWLYYPSAEFDLASVYLKKNVRIETIPALMKNGIAYQKEHTFDSDLYKNGGNSDADAELGVEIRAADLLSDAAQKLHRPEIAATAVTSLQSLSPKNGYSKSEIWKVRAKFAELEGRKLDALALYRMAIQERPADANVGDHDELAENEQRLWKELGGTNEGYPLWRTQTAAIDATKEEWAKPAKTMTDWTLPDLQGKKWQLSDFHGRVLLINVWATWCLPCQEELPYLQKLYDRIKDRTDVQIVTLNVDEDVANTMVFEKKMGYTFPILLAQGHQEELDINSGRGIPRNWIVDGGGTWAWDRQSDFKLDETLPDQILAKMESAKSK